MNFSSETILGLKRLCNTSLVNDQHFHELVDSCIRAVQTDELINKSEYLYIIRIFPVIHEIYCLGKSIDGKLDVIKVAYASLTVLYTEAARHSMDSDILKDILEGYNLNHDRISFIVETYDKNKPQIQHKLMRIGTSYPHIVEIHWRMDYTIKVNFIFTFRIITSAYYSSIFLFVCSQIVTSSTSSHSFISN